MRARLPALMALIALVLAGLATLTGWLGSAPALLAGMALALTLGNPQRARTQVWSGLVMKTAIVGMGFGLPLDSVLGTARDGFWLTAGTIAMALSLGWLLAKVLKIDRDLGSLLSAGTAICGGSAIAAIAPAIQARSEAIVMAVAIVFLLNGLGLLIFPPLGHWLGLTQAEFGLWAALAIHDTSSVVGAAASYGPEALNVATTAKLARAIWIIPLVFFFAWRAQKTGKPSWPTFIGLFLLASLARTLVPAIAEFADIITMFAKHLFALSLLMIGAGITRSTLHQLSWRPLLMAVVLWLGLATTSLVAIRAL